MAATLPLEWNWKHPVYDAIYKERSERLERLRKDPSILPALHEYYKDKPADWIEDFCITYDPRNLEIDLPATVPFVLFPKQREFLNWLYERWRNRESGVVEKSRDAGVSWLCVAFAVWMWRHYPGSAIGFGSRKEEYVDQLGDPKSLFWKARSLIDYLPDEMKPEGFNRREHAPHMRILNPENDASIIGEAGDNIGRGARASLYFVDEAAFIERAESVDAALSQTANCKIHVSTPNGAGNVFYRKRHGGKFPVFVFDWRDDPRKDEAWYKIQCDTLDPVVLAQEVDRNYEASVSNALIPGDIVDAAMNRGPAEVLAIGGLRVGIDVARFGDDNTVITIRRGRVLLKQVVLKHMDVMQVASMARREIDVYQEEPEQIAVDTIGLGAGVADILRGWYPNRLDPRTGRKIETVVDVNCALRVNNGRDYNLRAQMWREMKEWLTTASIPKDHALRTDLTSLRYEFRGGEMILESKADAKKRGVKSPDRADSLSLTLAIPTQSRIEVKKLPAYQQRVTGMGMLG